MPRGRRAFSAADLVVPALAALTLSVIAAVAQTPAFDTGPDLMAPAPEGGPSSLQRNRGGNGGAASQIDAPPTGVFTPSRIGATPTYGTRPGFGAADTGFDSSNTGQRKRPVKKAAPAVAGQAPPESTFTPVPTFTLATPAPPPPAPPPPPPVASGVQPLKAQTRPGAVLPPLPDAVPVSNPPATIYPRPAAERPGAVLPIPPLLDFQPSASTPPPGTPPLNTLPLGTPQRPLPIAAGDPYAALGLRAGSFLLHPAVELSTGYDSNPEHVPGDLVRQRHRFRLLLRPADLPADQPDHDPARQLRREPADGPGPGLQLRPGGKRHLDRGQRGYPGRDLLPQPAGRSLGQLRLRPAVPADHGDRPGAPGPPPGGALSPPQQVSNDDSVRTGLAQPGDGNAMGTYTESYSYDAVGNILAMAHQAGRAAGPGGTAMPSRLRSWRPRPATGCRPPACPAIRPPGPTTAPIGTTRTAT